MYYGGYYGIISLLKRTSGHRLLIVMYHDLVSADSQAGAVYYGALPSQSQFRQQLLALQKRFRILSVEEAVSEIKDRGQLLCPTACITFDDGCLSVYTLAFPVLKELGLTATVYLPTDWINRRGTPWWIILRNIIAHWNPQRVEPRELLQPLAMEPEFTLPDTKASGESKSRLCSHLEDYLRDQSDQEIAGFLERLKKAAMVELPNKLAGDDPVNWEQIKEMARSGIRFGAHTRSHINLKFADKIEAEREIIESRNEIEAHLPRQVRGFAYPYGTDLPSYEKLGDFLRQSNFDYACTALYGVNKAGDNLYLLKRITLPASASAALLGRQMILDYHLD